MSAGLTARLLGRTPQTADAGCGPGPDVGVALLAVELYLLVLADTTHVRPVLVLANDADEENLAMRDGAGVRTVHCRHTR